MRLLILVSISIYYIACNGDSCVCRVSTRTECEVAGALKYAPDGTIKRQCSWQASHKKCRNTNWLECKQDQKCIWIHKIADEVENNASPQIESDESTIGDDIESSTSRLITDNSDSTEIDENESVDIENNEPFDVDDSRIFDVDNNESFDVDNNDLDENGLIIITDDSTADGVESNIPNVEENQQISQVENDEFVPGDFEDVAFVGIDENDAYVEIEDNESGDFEDDASVEIEEKEPPSKDLRCPVDQQGDDEFEDEDIVFEYLSDAEKSQKYREQNEQIVMSSIQTQTGNMRVIALLLVIIVAICGGIYHFNMKKKKTDALRGLNQYGKYNYSTF